MVANPIEQFEIRPIFRIANIAGHEIYFTNSAAYMLAAVVLTAALMLGPTAARRLVPSRMQSVAELSYEFITNMIRSAAGEHGLKFFPLVVSLFAPRRVPLLILPIIVIIEILSFFARPISHSVRLFANILAGHITLKLVAGFVVAIGSLGAFGWLAAT